jgi:hypothetical protein
MGSAAMNRIWAGLPIAMLVAVPLWTESSMLVFAIGALAVLPCVIGVLLRSLALVITGALFAVAGYAVALWSANAGFDAIGGAIFGLALLFCLDISEFAQRFHGARVATEVIQAQTAYWLARAAIIALTIALLVLSGSVLGLLVPGSSRAAIAGLGSVIAFGGALYAVMRRTGADDV